jgi:hypothetical protein
MELCGTWWRPCEAFFRLEGFGAGRAYTKGQLRLFLGDVTGQVQISFGNLDLTRHIVRSR